MLTAAQAEMGMSGGEALNRNVGTVETEVYKDTFSVLSSILGTCVCLVWETWNPSPESKDTQSVTL